MPKKLVSREFSHQYHLMSESNYPGARMCPPDHPQPDLQPAIRVIMMPWDTNPMGTIFGGIILSYIDQAGAVEARKHTAKTLATVAMHEVKFHAPVHVGDLVSFYTETIRIGRTSITVGVRVEAGRGAPPHETVLVTQAEVVYVAVEKPGTPIPIRD